MALETVPIELLGLSFTIQTDESREYMETLVSELERRLAALQGSTRVVNPLKLSILVSLTLLDELARLRGRSSEDEELARIAERLIGRLDEGLGAIPPPRD